MVIDGRTAEQQNRNEYALGHMCNHAGGMGVEGTANVISVAYDFPQDPLGWEGFPEHLRPYIPNSLAKPRYGAPCHTQLCSQVVSRMGASYLSSLDLPGDLLLRVSGGQDSNGQPGPLGARAESGAGGDDGLAGSGAAVELSTEPQVG